MDFYSVLESENVAVASRLLSGYSTGMSLQALSDAEIQSFIADGFVPIEGAFARETAEAARGILWRDTGCVPGDPTTWTRPVIRLGEYSQPPFLEAAGAPRLQAALDQIVGRGRWLPRHSLGSFPVRFPSLLDSDDAGWHVDGSFPGGDPSDYWTYRINVASRGRALLMLFLFSDVGERDAPTRLRVASHRTVARILAPAGDGGLSFMDLAGRLDATEQCPVAFATGTAGTVYLCHPFLAHAAQRHCGREPRFMAQPPLFPAQPLCLDRADHAYSPVEEAIRQALASDS